MVGRGTTSNVFSSQSENLWKTIFSLSGSFFAMEPWKRFSEVDIFGIQSPETGMVYYISIMGELGESFSLAAYQGDEALEQFWYLKEGGSNLPVGTIMTIPHLMVSLSKLRDTGKEQVDYIKQLGMKPVFKNLYPNVAQVIPGLLPATPGLNILTDLVHILDQTIWVVRHAEMIGKAFIHAEGDGEFDYYVRIPDSSEEMLTWKDTKITLNQDVRSLSVTYNSADLDRFKKLPPCRDVLQMELCPLLFPVREAGKPDFFPVVFLMVNSRTGIIEMFETMTPLPSYQEMVAQLPTIIMKHSFRMGWRPAQVKYRSFQLGPIITFLTKHANTKACQSFDLSEVDDALNSLAHSITKGRQKGFL